MNWFRVGLLFGLSVVLTIVFIIALAGLLSGFYSSSFLILISSIYLGLLGLLVALGIRYGC